MGKLPVSKKLTDFERQKADEIRKIISDVLKEELVNYWKIGLLVQEIYLEAEKFVIEHGKKTAIEEERTGPQRVGLVAQELGLHPRTLMDALRVVERWETKERFLEIANASNKKQLSFAHMKEISRLPDDNVALKVAKEAAEKGATVRELQLILRKAEGKSPPRGCGRKPEVPSDVETCLASIQGSLLAIFNKLNSVWFGEEYDLISELNKFDPQMFVEAPEFYDKVVDTLKLINEVGEALVQKAEMLAAFIDSVAYIFDLADKNVIDIEPEN